MRRLYHYHHEKINYLLIGGWNTLLGYLIFVALYYLFRQIIHYLILLIISNILSITNAYISYKIFVFKTRRNYLREYLRFYVVYGGAFALNFILLPVCVELFHIQPVIAQGVLMFLTVIFSYFGHKNYSFKKKLERKE